MMVWAGLGAGEAGLEGGVRSPGPSSASVNGSGSANGSSGRGVQMLNMSGAQGEFSKMSLS
jgi:hypothetical protein